MIDQMFTLMSATFIFLFALTVCVAVISERVEKLRIQVADIENNFPVPPSK
jgi:hypothetical protein